jgi:predicted solute-binding protein
MDFRQRNPEGVKVIRKRLDLTRILPEQYSTKCTITLSAHNFLAVNDIYESCQEYHYLVIKFRLINLE